jgi:hypothetical protein
MAEHGYAECHVCWLSLMLSVTHILALYAECHYAECRYAECHYVECRYAEYRGTLRHQKTALEPLVIRLYRS